jgi:hypothetical protein
MEQVIEPTLVQARAVMPILTPAQFAYLIRTVLGLRTAEQRAGKLTVHQQLRLYLYEWLVHLRFVTEAKRERLLARIDSDLGTFSSWLEQNFRGSRSHDHVPIFTVNISDRRFAVWPGARKWYDLVQDEDVDQLPRPAVTHIALDVFALFAQKQEWLERRFPQQQGGRDARKRDQQGQEPALPVAEHSQEDTDRRQQLRHDPSGTSPGPAGDRVPELDTDHSAAGGGRHLEYPDASGQP